MENILLVKDIMKKIPSVSPSTTLKEITQIMIKYHTPVVAITEGDKVVGSVDIEDLLEVFIPEYFDLIEDFSSIKTFGVLDTKMFSDLSQKLFLAQDLMSKDFFSIEEDASLSKAILIMHKKKVTALIVVKNSEYRGVITEFDLMRKLYEVDID